MGYKALLLYILSIGQVICAECQQVTVDFDSLVGLAMQFEFAVARIDTSYSQSDSCMKYLYFDSRFKVRKSVLRNVDGDIRRIANYDDMDKIHGIGLELYPNRSLRSLTTYVHGMGVAYHFDERGQLEEWYMAKDSRITGRRQQFYSNGALLNDAVLDGSIWIERGYYEDGVLEHRGRSNDGQPIGEWEYFNNRGRRIRSPRH